MKDSRRRSRTWNSAAACMVTAGDACSSFRHCVAHFGYSVRDTYACMHMLHRIYTLASNRIDEDEN